MVRFFGKKKPLPVQSHRLQYYLYISRTKLETLIPQIPPDFIRAFEAEIKVNLGVIGATVKGKPIGDRPELAAQARLLTSYLESKDRVGSLISPERYIKDSAPFQYGIVSDCTSDLVFFGGPVGDMKVGLIGSSDSLIGAVPKVESSHSSYHYTMRLLNCLVDREPEGSRKAPYYSHLRTSVDVALNALPSATFQLEFLAKTLYRKSNLIIATPIYVALVD